MNPKIKVNCEKIMSRPFKRNRKEEQLVVENEEG